MVGLALIASVVFAVQLPARGQRLIHDTANVIDDRTERVLEQRSQRLFAKTGVAIAVLTVPRLEGETIDELAVRAGQTWGVGRKGEDRGLVIALSREDRRIFVATGYGVEGFLPDGRVGALIDEHAIPYLEKSQYSEGITRLTFAIADVTARELGVTLAGTQIEQRPVQSRAQPGWLRVIVMIVLMLGFGFLAWRRPMLAMLLFAGMGRGRAAGGFGGGGGFGGFGGGGFGGGGAGRGF